jgi:c-di-AMP phosphodiesterase-like protein
MKILFYILNLIIVGLIIMLPVCIIYRDMDMVHILGVSLVILLSVVVDYEWYKDIRNDRLIKISSFKK